ncbi:MAG TPA: FixH family protein, partial [Kofleriaceae bacterium]|nr:FixH family protein [Kofleriaceae bacterium]
MLSRRTIALPALLAALALAPACGGDDGHGDHEEEVNCAEETRDDTYVANLAKDGERGNLSVVLVESDPGPPAKGDNAWTLQLVDADQQPVDGATVTVTPFMPDHGHGTPIDVEVTPGGGAGMY